MQLPLKATASVYFGSDVYFSLVYNICAINIYVCGGVNFILKTGTESSEMSRYRRPYQQLLQQWVRHNQNRKL